MSDDGVGNHNKDNHDKNSLLFFLDIGAIISTLGEVEYAGFFIQEDQIIISNHQNNHLSWIRQLLLNKNN